MYQLYNSLCLFSFLGLFMKVLPKLTQQNSTKPNLTKPNQLNQLNYDISSAS